MLNRYINDLLPQIFRASETVEDTTWRAMQRVLLQHHRYAMLYTATGDAAKDLTVHKWLNLLTIQAMLMFVMAIFFTFQVSLPISSVQRGCSTQKT